MDNDNKVAAANTANISHKEEVRLFLKEELAPIEQAKRFGSYNVVEEYAKTKKNRNPYIVVILSLCAAVVILIAVCITLYLSKQNRKIEISPDVFNDLDMSTLLAAKSHAEIKYLVAANKVAQLNNDCSRELKQAAFDHDSLVYVINALRLETGADEEKAAAQKAYAVRSATIHAKYDTMIVEAQKAADDAKAKLDAIATEDKNDSDFANQVQQHERDWMVDSYTETMTDLKSYIEQMQKKDYESQHSSVERVAVKYQKEVDALDPTLSDKKAEDIVSMVSGVKIEPFSVEAYNAILPQLRLTEDFKMVNKTVQSLFVQYDYIHGLIAAVPQKHSMLVYKDAENILVNRIVQELSKGSAGQINTMDTDIQRLEAENAQLKAENGQLKTENGQLMETVAKYEKSNSKSSKIKN